MDPYLNYYTGPYYFSSSSVNTLPIGSLQTSAETSHLKNVKKAKQIDNSCSSGILQTATDEYPWKNTTKITQALYDHSALSNPQIDAIIEFIGAKLPQFLKQARAEQKDKRLRIEAAKLQLPPVEISKEGYIQVPLKKWGEMLGKGEFRKTQLAIALSCRDFPVMAHSTQRICSIMEKKISDSEIMILKKIARFLGEHPEAKGLLKFFSVLDYPLKSSIKSLKLSDSSGYEANLAVSSQKKASDEPLFKRAISTKFYNMGNLKECMESLSLANRMKIGQFLLMGLVHLHSLKIFHSDIKTDNMFIEGDLNKHIITDAVIGDFGFACDLANPEDRFFKNGHKSCRPPELLDTPTITGKVIDETILTADVYAMGLVLKELFEGLQKPKFDNLITQMISDKLEMRPSAQTALDTYEALLSG